MIRYIIAKKTDETVIGFRGEFKSIYPKIDYSFSFEFPTYPDSNTLVYPLPQFRFLEKDGGPLSYIVDDVATTLGRLAVQNLKHYRFTRSLTQEEQYMLMAYLNPEGHITYTPIKGIHHPLDIRLPLYDEEGKELQKGSISDRINLSSDVEVFEPLLCVYRIAPVRLGILWRNRRKKLYLHDEGIKEDMRKHSKNERKGLVWPVDFQTEIDILRNGMHSFYFQMITDKEVIQRITPKPTLEEFVLNHK